MKPTIDAPPLGSLWAARCPDAYPAAWFDTLGLSTLPTGFSRFATPGEEDIIFDKVVTTTGDTPSTPVPTRSQRGVRWHVLNGFLDGTMRGLTFGETKIWLLLFRDARGGIARTGHVDMARRSGLSVRGVQKVISRLVKKRLLSIVRRGGLRAGPSSYRVHPP